MSTKRELQYNVSMRQLRWRVWQRRVNASVGRNKVGMSWRSRIQGVVNGAVGQKQVQQCISPPEGWWTKRQDMQESGVVDCPQEARPVVLRRAAAPGTCTFLIDEPSVRLHNCCWIGIDNYSSRVRAYQRALERLCVSSLWVYRTF